MRMRSLSPSGRLQAGSGRRSARSGSDMAMILRSVGGGIEQDAGAARGGLGEQAGGGDTEQAAGAGLGGLGEHGGAEGAIIARASREVDLHEVRGRACGARGED